MLKNRINLSHLPPCLVQTLPSAIICLTRTQVSEGLLETGYDWYVQWVDMDTSTLKEREFLGVFTDWKKQVEEYKINGKKDLSIKPASIDPKELTISQIVGSLKPAQLWTIIVTIVTAIVAIAGAAYKLGTLNPTPVKTGSSLENVYQISELSVSRSVGIIWRK